MATIYAKVLETHKLDQFDQVEWRPWINVKPDEQGWLPRMILNRWVRDRGGIERGTRLNVSVFFYDDDEVKRHSNGKPAYCGRVDFVVSEQEVAST